MRHLPAVFALAVVVLTSARAAALPVGGCPPGLIHTYSPAFVTSPTSGTAVDSTQSIPLTLYVPSLEGYINVYARNWADDFQQTPIQTITPPPGASSVTTELGTYYYWTYPLTLTQPENDEYWAPPIDPPDTTFYSSTRTAVPASLGRLELSFVYVAPQGTCAVEEMGTFSEAAMTNCYEPGGDLAAAAEACADGAALVLFDNNGGVKGSDNISGLPSWNPQSPNGSPLYPATMQGHICTNLAKSLAKFFKDGGAKSAKSGRHRVTRRDRG
jgi:hypothetical protein